MKPSLIWVTVEVRRALAGGVFVLVVLVWGRADAATCYVSTTGSDSGSGTLASPFQTLGKGVSVLRPGDTLYARAGIYVDRISGEPLFSSPCQEMQVAPYCPEEIFRMPERTHFGGTEYEALRAFLPG